MADGEPGGQQMRQARAQGFAGMTAQLVHLIRLASTAMRHATAALFNADPPAAESITAAYEAVSVLRDELEDHAAVLLGLRVQSGVLELLATIAAVHIDAETERIGQLAREVADIARTRRGWASISAPLLGVLRELSEVRFETAAKAADVVESHTATSAVELAARCHERFAEHARALTRYRALLAVGAPSGRGGMRGNPQLAESWCTMKGSPSGRCGVAVLG
ncbi:PhoU domain-containing protein [Mycobacterium haemophilum]|uniref:PhoU domain-containing protein n=1 Tax=Mycobacterium haemophilum TaxID=29311 RepID=UPI0006D5CCBB|nr:PhoU domain-containing protein [Mycobacterium haemophilum]MCV7341587.1 PhoU domain-containing protein [Mycobacterium haemophilum DSM 44634]